MPAAAIPGWNARFSEVDGAYRDPFDPALTDPTELVRSIDERLAIMKERVDKGEHVEGQPGSFAAASCFATKAGNRLSRNVCAETLIDSRPMRAPGPRCRTACATTQRSRSGIIS